MPVIRHSLVMKIMPMILILLSSAGISHAAESTDPISPDSTRRGEVLLHPFDTGTAADTLTFPTSLANTKVYNIVKTEPLATTNDKGSPEDENRNWWHLLKEGKLKMNDPDVEWPGFLGFCVKVYNWGDRVFNSYDEEYVQGTGTRWKVRLTTENWVDTHAFDFRRKQSMRFMSNITSTLGGYLQYMAVSVGYSLDMSNIIGNAPTNHKKWGLGFTCARFSAELYWQQNTGGSYLHKMTGYNDNMLFKEAFPGLSFSTGGIEAYYFFNNRRYSQGAAYNFSKIQKKSQGSAIIGFAFTSVKNVLDFGTLPDNLRPYFNLNTEHLTFHYKNYCLVGGYGHNFVAGKLCLFNVTAMPRIGLARCYEDSYNAKGTMLSLGVNAKASFTMNLGNYFLCLSFTADGNWYNSGDYSLFSSVENVALSIGKRF